MNIKIMLPKEFIEKQNTWKIKSKWKHFFKFKLLYKYQLLKNPLR